MNSHKKNIISLTTITKGDILPGDIIQFSYSGENVTDGKPLVFVLPQLAEVSGGGKKATTALLTKGGTFAGLNLHFLTMYTLEKLLKEDNFLKLKQWNLYNEAFRTYSVSKVRAIKLVEFKTDKQLKEERVDNKPQQPEPPKQPEPPQQPKKPVNQRRGN